MECIFAKTKASQRIISHTIRVTVAFTKYVDVWVIKSVYWWNGLRLINQENQNDSSFFEMINVCVKHL